MLYIWFHMGVFMISENSKTENWTAAAWAQSLFTWLLVAAILLLFSAWLLARGVIPYRSVGYLSSAISFLAALLAGRTLSRREDVSVLASFSGAVCLVILLLTTGYIVSRGELSPSGILSTASFTIAGFLAGALMPGKRRTKKRNALISVRKRR